MLIRSVSPAGESRPGSMFEPERKCLFRDRGFGALQRMGHYLYSQERKCEADLNMDTHAEILKRLRTSEGHLRAVIEMAQADKPCEEVLHQLNALQAALRAAACQLIQCQVQKSRSIIMTGSTPGERAAELKRLQSLYTLFAQFSNRMNEVINE
jgi:DNA-binding FrmR family transcriptional regulator